MDMGECALMEWNSMLNKAVDLNYPAYEEEVKRLLAIGWETFTMDARKKKACLVPVMLYADGKVTFEYDDSLRFDRTLYGRRSCEQFYFEMMMSFNKVERQLKLLDNVRHINELHVAEFLPENTLPGSPNVNACLTTGNH